MRKIVITICLFYLFSSGLMSQWNNLRIGIQFSPNISHIQTNDNLINSNGSNFGIKFGTSIEWYLSESLSVHSGLHIAFNQGGKLLHDIGGDLLYGSSLSNESLHRLPEGVNIKYNTQQIEFPLGVRWRSKERKDKRYFVDLPGITMGFRTKATAKINGNNVSTGRENVNKSTPLINLYYGMGGGMEYSLTEDISLQIGLIFQNSLSDFIRNNGEKYIYGVDTVEKVPEDSFAALKQFSLRIAILF